MDKVKSSSEGRVIFMETICYDNLPKKAKTKIRYERYERIKKFSYNAGGELVNYGLNTFVRDVFVYFNGSAAIYSDRFGNYYKIKDEKIIKCLADSNKVTVTDEGILVFYRQGTDTNAYFTLNFKSGILTQFSALLNDTSKLNVKVYEIFSKYGKTFAQIQADDKNNKENLFFYYLLDFSFNFYESYGSTIKIHTYDLSDKITVKEDITPNFKFDIESCKIYKNKTTLTLKKVKEKCQLSKFTSKFGDSYLENEKIMSAQYDSSNLTYIYYDEGDIGINDSINSFVNSIRYCSALPVRRNFKLFEEYKVALIMGYDRFKDLDVYRVEENDIFNKILNSSVHYVSLEGVIVTLYSNYYDSPKLFVYISLDGFIWRSYNLSHLLDEQYKYAKFTSNGSKNYITVYDTSDYSQNKKDYFVDFKFNFWDLYNSPVEMFFD